jgi:hypothetical protein
MRPLGLVLAHGVWLDQVDVSPPDGGNIKG